MKASGKPILIQVSVILMGLVFGGLLGYHAWKQDWMKVASLQFELSPDSAEEVLFETIQSEISKRLSHWRGVWLWDADLKDIHREVLEDRRVQSAAVSRLFPNRIVISVQPHRPVLGLLDAKGKIHPLGADGSLLPPVSTAEILDFPILRGLHFFESEDLRKEATELYRNLPHEGVLSRANLSEIRHTKGDGYKLFLIKPEIQVLVGDQDITPKTSRVEQVLRYLEGRNIKGRIVDARMAGKVVVKVND